VRFYGWHWIVLAFTTSVVLTLCPVSAFAKTHCCFELAVNGQQDATLDYGDDLPQPYHGLYSLARSWSVRAIVTFKAASPKHPATLVEPISPGATEVRLSTDESSSLSERHARRDEHGNYTYPYEPIPCTSGHLGLAEHGVEGLHSQTGAVSLLEGSSGYHLRVDLHSLFNSQPPACGGGADLALHVKDGADTPVTELPAPKLKFFQIASAGDRKTRSFEAPPVSITHGGLSGLHTFGNERSAQVSLSWFPYYRIDRELDRLHHIQCGPQFCNTDSWGGG
jgi:hypothetical protein